MSSKRNEPVGGMSAKRDGLKMAVEKSFKVLIERELILVNQKTHSKKKIRVQIGSPRWKRKGEEAACPVAIEGWLGRVVDIRGVDPMNALEMALYFTNSLFKDLPSPKKVTWPNGDSYEGTYPDPSMVASDALVRRLVKIQRQVISNRRRQRRKK